MKFWDPISSKLIQKRSNYDSLISPVYDKYKNNEKSKMICSADPNINRVSLLFIFISTTSKINSWPK